MAAIEKRIELLESSMNDSKPLYLWLAVNDGETVEQAEQRTLHEREVKPGSKVVFVGWQGDAA
jgi:hypothetical protein